MLLGSHVVARGFAALFAPRLLIDSWPAKRGVEILTIRAPAVRLEYGRIVAMQFLEQNCDRCGGSSSVLCVGRFACSTAISDCKSSSYLVS